MQENSDKSTETVAGEIRETGILIDHDLNIVYVDTTERGMANKFRKIGLEEVTKDDSGRYKRFKGNADLISVSRRRTGVKISEASLRALREHPIKSKKNGVK